MYISTLRRSVQEGRVSERDQYQNATTTHQQQEVEVAEEVVKPPEETLSEEVCHKRTHSHTHTLTHSHPTNHAQGGQGYTTHSSVCVGSGDSRVKKKKEK